VPPPKNIYGVTKIAAENLCELFHNLVLDLLDAGEDPLSPLARAVGSKGYHAHAFADEPYPVE
jgi:hypothetical protein